LVIENIPYAWDFKKKTKNKKTSQGIPGFSWDIPVLGQFQNRTLAPNQ
jgi:hypothetical protein